MCIDIKYLLSCFYWYVFGRAQKNPLERPLLSTVILTTVSYQTGNRSPFFPKVYIQILSDNLNLLKLQVYNMLSYFA